MSHSIAMQTRTAVLGIVAGFILGASGAAVAATSHRTTGPNGHGCMTRTEQRMALRTLSEIGADNADLSKWVDNGYPQLQHETNAAQTTVLQLQQMGVDTTGCPNQ